MEWINKNTELYYKIMWNYFTAESSRLRLKYFNTTWSKEEISDLENNYHYYIDHQEEAKVHFKRKWNVINKKAIKLGLRYDKWTDEQLKNLSENYFYYITNKNEAENYFKKSWASISSMAKSLKITSSKINKDCPAFLGCYVAERVLSYVFKDVERMPYGNKGFDFVCNKGLKIDVKASCLGKNNQYIFNINNNKVPDYFLLVAFNNRFDLTPQHVWLIKGSLINKFKILAIVNNDKGMSKFLKYELIDKLRDVISCCDKLKTMK